MFFLLLLLGDGRTKFTAKELHENTSSSIIRGIKHTNQLNDEDCRPMMRVLNGGLNTHTATVKITSERGCGIDSLVEFYIENV